MSKFSVGDTVRVTKPSSPLFDQAFKVCGTWRGSREWVYNFTVRGETHTLSEHHLTLADPDVHTVLDQMDAESAPAAFKAGERVMVRGEVSSYGGLFGEVTGTTDDGAIEWDVKLDGRTHELPFTEDELIHIAPRKDITEQEIDGEYVRGGVDRTPLADWELELLNGVEPAPVEDVVNHPSHYTSSPAKCANCGAGIECIQITEHMGFNLGSAVKYVWRCDLKKNAIQDLEKAVWYIEREIAKRKAAQ